MPWKTLVIRHRLLGFLIAIQPDKTHPRSRNQFQYSLEHAHAGTENWHDNNIGINLATSCCSNRSLNRHLFCLDVLEGFVTDELGYFGRQFSETFMSGRDITNYSKLVLHAGVFNQDCHSR